MTAKRLLVLFTCLFAGVASLNLTSALTPDRVYAATISVWGTVTNQASTPVPETTITVIDPSTNLVVTSTTTDIGGNYSVAVAEGTYNIRVVPPMGTGLQPTILLSQVLTADTNLNVVLVPVSSLVTLRGSVLDRLGRGVPSQDVTLVDPTSGPVASARTATNGSYAIQVVPGSYMLRVSGANGAGATAPGVPSQYSLQTDAVIPFLEGVQFLDLTLPLQEVRVHVEYTLHAAVSGVQVDASDTPMSGVLLSNYPSHGSDGYFGKAYTDSAGNTTLWLFRTSGQLYNLTARPPTGSSYSITTLLDVAVTGDTSRTITLISAITVQGRVLNRAGNGVPNHFVYVGRPGEGPLASARTTADGSYSLQVEPGTYYLRVDTGGSPITAPGVPNYYSLQTDSPISFLQDTVLNIPMPVNQVSVHVENTQHVAVANVQISTNQPCMSGLMLGSYPAHGCGGVIGANTNSAGDTVLWLFSTSGQLYTLTLTPPPGSNDSLTIVPDIAVTGDTSRTVTLIRAITIQGRVLNRAGTGVPNHYVYVVRPGDGPIASSRTTSDGSYSIPVAAGSYYLRIDSGGSPVFAPGVPDYYTLQTDDVISFPQDTTLNIPMPVMQVSVRLQNALGVGVPNVQISTNQPCMSGLMLGSYSAHGCGGRVLGASTNSGGDAVLWLFPTSGQLYTLTVTPPTGSPFVSFPVPNVTVTQDLNLVIALQYVHPAPMTTASTSPVPNGQGVYPGPVTVGLSATAHPGYSVAATYYTVDGSAPTSYTGPFVVSGDGGHTVTYWSADNLGVTEAPHTLALQIMVNQAPLVAAGGPYSVAEGGAVALAATGTDPENGSLVYAWDLDGDGSFETPGENPTFSAALIDGPGSRNVAVRVTDTGNLTASSVATITIENVAPTADFGTASPVNEGETIRLSLTTSYDPSRADSAAGLNYAFNCGDGSGYGPFGPNTTASCPTLDNGTRTVGGKVQDKDAGVTEYTANVNVLNVAPAITPAPAQAGNEGSVTPFNLGSFVDVASDGPWLVDIDWGDGAEPTTFNATSPGSLGTQPHTYVASGDYSARVSVTDKDAGISRYTIPIIINNVAPGVTAPGVSPGTSVEGSAVTAGASFTDPAGAGDAPFSCLVNYGDGSGDLAGSVTGFTCVGPAHTYPDNGTYTVTVSVTDKDDGTGLNTTTQVVANLPPAVGAITAPLEPVLYSTVISISASFADPGTGDTHTAVWNWGDNTTSGGIVTEANGSGWTIGTHTYTNAGVYTVQVTVTDDDNAAASATYQYVVVYNPDGGFVTGGGWINSPAGAYRPDPTLTGRAAFGFVSKYQPGRQEPGGETEFTFRAGTMNFHADAYEWLVIAGPKAQYWGTGTLDGQAGYSFLLTAWDGQVNGGGGADRFRIKIMDSAQRVVYDNQLGAPDNENPTTVIGGGSIRIDDNH